MSLHDTVQTRHPHSKSKQPLVLAEDHPAVVEGRPLFRRSANEHKRHKARILVSGHNSRKIGKTVTKGALCSFPIYTLTLTERATCPRDCPLYLGCYGNRSPWSIRWPADAETENRIEAELADLQHTYPGGFLVRLHVLGDFYSTGYVARWHTWMLRFPALHVFGFTARHGDDIADALVRMELVFGRRWVVRSSEGRQPGLPISRVVSDPAATEGIHCPAQQHKTAACATCALCWSAPDKIILFTPH